MSWIDLVQWPAMVVTVVSAWMVASQRTWKRNEGFWLFLFSNILWVVWGIHARAIAVVLLQVCLAVLNFRGVFKTSHRLSRRLEP
jgi:presenilin-like A22 family membrane protease